MLDLKTRNTQVAPPSARKLAQMTALVKKNQMPPFAAGMLATMMTTETAQQVEADLVTAFEYADAMNITLENDLKPLLQKALDAFGDDVAAGQEVDPKESPITARLAAAFQAKRVAASPKIDSKASWLIITFSNPASPKLI